MENYTPKIIEKENGYFYVEMLLHADKCPSCGKIMMHKVPEDLQRPKFPCYLRMNQSAQMKNAGIVFISNVQVNDAYICEDCASSGKAAFKCAFCGNQQSTDQIEESVGLPPEHVCKTCYATLPAKIWDEKLDELRESHRYDYV